MNIQKYIKKPIIVEAIKWSGNDNDYSSILALQSGTHIINKTYISHANNYPNNKSAIIIKTLQGATIANPDDWVIKGITGEIYACTDSIFKQTYEVV